MTTHSAKGTLSLSESLQQSLKSKHDAIEFVKPFIELPTIVAAGMCLQALAFLIIPHYIAVAPAVVLLCYKAITSKTVTVADNWLVNQKWAGRMTATIPNEDGSIPEKGATNGLVCFFVGVQVNHPMGLLGPSVKDAGDLFNNIWGDAEADPEKSGYLSRTPPLTGTGESGGTYLVTFSYWKTLDQLHAFAAKSVHAKARRWWERNHQQVPHLGIFHETYDVPPGNYESIYDSFHPFGMGTIGLGKEKGQALKKAEGKRGGSMHSRMGREE